MTASIKQAVAFANNNGSTTPTVVITGVTAGNTLYLVLFTNSGLPGGGFTVSDGTNAWSAALETSTTTYATQTFVAEDVAGGSFTITASPTTNYPTGIVIEVQGVSSAPLDGHAINGQSAPGSGTGALTVGPPSPDNLLNPVLVVAVTADQYGGSDTGPSVGAGYTLFGTYSPWGGSNRDLVVEYAYLPTGTAAAATFTANTGVDTYVTCMAVFDEAPPPTPPPPNTSGLITSAACW